MEAATPCQGPALQGAHIGVHIVIGVHIIGVQNPPGTAAPGDQLPASGQQTLGEHRCNQRGKTWAHGPSSHTGSGAPETACARRNSKN